MKRRIVLLFWFFSLLFTAYSQVPSGYYNSAAGKTGDVLRAALRDIIKNGAVKLSYTSSSSMDVWHAFAKTDLRPAPNNTIVWDMYSDIPGGTPAYTYTIYSGQCGTSGAEGTCYAREHCMPNSWWGGIDDANNPQYTDLNHLFPADQFVNMEKSDHPLGVVTSPTFTSTNGSKVGPCSYAGYTGTVFEPIDEYKGDFARAYLYMATRYMDQLNTWITNYPNSEGVNVITGNNFKPWFVNLLIDWSVNDPVSQKEIDRNNAIYYNTPQHNRNPFIDHPEYVCLIWNGPSCINIPSITNVNVTPAIPTATQTVTISANITDNGSITSAKMKWGLTPSTVTTQINMTATTGSTYTSVSAIPAHAAGTYIYYKIIATNNTSQNTTSPIYSFEVPLPEPTNQATNFTCDSTNFYSIKLNWTDATGATTPTSYLVKMSTVGFSAISTPVDGIPEIFGTTSISNIPQGVHSCTFTGLAVSTTYYFKIFPYTNTGTYTNYKTNGNVASTSCSTTSPGGSFNCVSQGFDSGIAAPADWTFNSITQTYTTPNNYGSASPSLSFDASNESIESQEVFSPASISFWIKGEGVDTISHLLVEGYNDNLWTTIAVVKPLPTTGTTKTYTSGLSGFSRFRFTYSKSIGNLAFDDVKISENNFSAPSAGADLTVCGGTAVTLTASGGSSYVWNNGVQQGIPFTPPASTTYTVTVTNSAACTATDQVFVSVNNIPKPTVILIGDTLISSAATGNQWYNQNGIISGATGKKYIPLINGNYYVIVIANGCSSDPSDIIPYVIGGIERNTSFNAINVYPNPVSDDLIIEIEGTNEKVAFEIINSSGLVVFKGSLINKTVVKTTDFAPGIYLLKLDNSKTFEFKKIIKE